MENSDEFRFAVETLMNICGGVLSRDVIVTVLESCGGDLNLAVDAVMKITNDNDNILPENVACDTDQVNVINNNEQRIVQSNEKCVTQNQPSSQNQTPSVSYAAASKKTGAMPKQQIKPNNSSPQADTRNWTDQFKRIVSYHILGYRILVLMRGLPGSGKTFLARQIVESTIGGKFVDFKTHICSTDDFFMCRGQYHFNRDQLRNAHNWNQERSKFAMEQGLSPLIIDNTNINIHDMNEYVKFGVPNGYIIEVVEPNTPWAKKANQLSRKNKHNVPLISIQRMLEKYVDNITGDYLLKNSGLSYPDDRVFRSMPVFHHDPQICNPMSTSNSTNLLQSTEYLNTNAVSRLSISEPRILQPTFNLSQEEMSIASTTNVAVDEMLAIPFTTDTVNISTITNDTSTLEESVQAIVTNYNNSKYNENLRLNTDVLDTEVLKQREFEKVEQEWESGENWVEEQQQQPSDTSNGPDNIASTAPKPQRKNKPTENSDEMLLETVNNTQDWSQISMFMPSWQNETTSDISEVVEVPTDTMSSSTSMEIGDAENSHNMYKVINATPKDINQFHMSFILEKIPEKRMLDKSSMTNDFFFTDHTKRCKSEENHFKELKKLFKNVSKTALREIFDKCMGDVNWAVEIVLDGVASNQLLIISEEAMLDEEEDTDCGEDHQCNCLAAYNIFPDKSQPQVLDEHPSINTKPVATGSTSKAQNQKKTKKDANMSEDSLSLKRMIEQNVRVSDNHYSEHCLKIMRFRHGETELSEEVTDTGVHEETELAACASSEPGYQETASCLPDDQDANSDDEDSYNSMDDVEKTVVVNFGKDFVTELDALFGRKDMTYPDKVLPKIRIPLSLLNEMNALWMESLMHQLDEHDKQSAIMLQEDEEFARQLAMKEAELALEGKEPEVPDFKEIMDIDFAISIYQKDVADWRSKEPNDLAAKLTRDKLYNLFPDVPKEILSELLMAHDNNFQNTVEVLLMSTGKADILEQKNGMNKFVMQKEMERQERILQEERRALTEVEWPLLPRGEVVEMAVVHEYRRKAERHLESRILNLQKANEYISRGVIQAATYFGDLANFHKIKYEQAHSLAAASLMQVHAQNCTDTATIDLHYLRVREAKESLDLFLDTHIQRLKETAGRGPRYHTLFFITGRGLHSNGQPKIKPCVRKRLLQRGLSCSERNPGLLTSRVCAEDKLTYQLP